MLENLFGHTWCDCLECDEAVAAFQTLIVRSGNHENNLALILVHFPHSNDTSYLIFGELYYLLSHDGEVQDPQLIDWDEDEDEDDDDY